MTGRLALDGVLADPSSRGLLLAASKDPDAKVTYLLTSSETWRCTTGLVCKIPTTQRSVSAVRREAHALVELRRMPLGRLSGTIPRYVSSVPAGTRVGPAVEMLVSTQLSGTPISVRYHHWRHTSRPGPVTRDLDLALDWLSILWAETSTEAAPLTWAGEVADEVAGRWDGSDLAAPAVARLRAADAAMSRHLCPRTTVHGDYWFGNVLLEDDRVSGVVDWEACDLDGWPLRDAARFLLSYSLYLDRHTRPGRRVPGHRGLRREVNGDAMRYAALGSGWYPSLVRARLGRVLRQLGLPAHLWYAVALTGIGEVAATANHEGFALDHLRVLAQLPQHPPRPRRSRG